VKENFKRNIFFYKHYYLDFYNKQTSAVQKKLNWTIELIMTIEAEKLKKEYFNEKANQ